MIRLTRMATLMTIACASAACSETTEPETSCWERIGLAGDNVRAIAVVGNSLFAAGDGKVSEYTADGSWRTRLSDIPDATALVYSPEADFLFLATYPGIVDPFDPPSGPWLFGSADRGATWEPKEGTGETYLEGGGAFAVFTQGNQPALFTGGGPVVVRSYDEGNTWERVLGGPDAGGGLIATGAVSPHTGRILLGGTDPLGWPWIFQSSDEGDSWTVVDPSNGDPDVAGFGIGDFFFDPDDPHRVVTGTGLGFIESLDGGVTWEWDRSAATNAPAIREFVQAAGALFAFGERREAPDFQSSNVLLMSTDNARSWTEIPIPEEVALVREALPIDGNTIAAATSDGVWVLDAGSVECTSINGG